MGNSGLIIPFEVILPNNKDTIIVKSNLYRDPHFGSFEDSVFIKRSKAGMQRRVSIRIHCKFK